MPHERPSHKSAADHRTAATPPSQSVDAVATPPAVEEAAKPSRDRSKLGRAASCLSPTNMIRGAVAHPWMSVAVVLSMAIPVIVAWFPSDYTAGPGGAAALDDLPMPGKVQYHENAGGQSSEERSPASLTARHAAPNPPGPFEPGWDVPAAGNGDGQSRHAAYRDDVDAGGSARTVKTVGANQPMAAQARGAWLTGVIEETQPTTSPGPRVRVTPSRRY